MLIGLAFAITLGAFGYRLSQVYYGRQSPTSQTLIAKMWIEPRKASVAAISGLIFGSHPGSSHHIPLPSLPFHCRLERGGRHLLAARSACRGLSRPAGSPRAPPSVSSPA